MVAILNGCDTTDDREATQHRIGSNRTNTARLRVAGCLEANCNWKKINLELGRKRFYGNWSEDRNCGPRQNKTYNLNRFLSLSSPVRLYNYSAHTYFSIKLTKTVMISEQNAFKYLRFS